MAVREDVLGRVLRYGGGTRKADAQALGHLAQLGERRRVIGLRKDRPDHGGDGLAHGLRERIRVLSQALIETEVAGLIGAERRERTGERTAYRNGTRLRTWDTRVGTIELAIRKVRPGTYFPSLCSRAGGPSTRCWRSCR